MKHIPYVFLCILGYVTRTVVPEMTYRVSSGTLNLTIPYLPYVSHPCATTLIITR